LLNRFIFRIIQIIIVIKVFHLERRRRYYSFILRYLFRNTWYSRNSTFLMRNRGFKLTWSSFIWRIVYLLFSLISCFFKILFILYNLSLKTFFGNIWSIWSNSFILNLICKSHILIISSKFLRILPIFISRVITLPNNRILKLLLFIIKIIKIIFILILF
jgi:hypothetical protein